MLHRVVTLTAHGVCVVAVLAIGRTIFMPSANAVPARVDAGWTLEVKGVDFARNSRTLLMVVQSGCSFCTASAPFYRQLAAAIAGSSVQLVAVSPEDAAVTREYLGSLQVPVTEVRSADLSSLGVVGTPTLIMVDSSGRVEDVWVGLLKPEGQAEVLGSVNRHRAAS